MRHFETELEELQQRLLEMGGAVEAAIHDSILSLIERDEEIAQNVLVNEARINQMEMDNDDLAVRLIGLHQPMATDLRFLTMAIKINNDLERMGDLAVNIVQRSLSLIKEPPVKPLIDIPHMARLAESMVHQSLDAFVHRDADLARGVLLRDDTVDDLRDATYRELVQFMQRDPATVSRALNLLFVARNLERIADHATNIAEEVLFLVKGIDVRHHCEVGESQT